MYIIIDLKIGAKIQTISDMTKKNRRMLGGFAENV